MSQTSYVRNFVKALAGMLADNGVRDILSRVNVSVAVNYGVFVSQGSNDNECILPGLATDITDAKLALGVAVATQAQESQAGSADPNYPAKFPINVIHKGRVYVVAEEAVTPADPVFVRYVAGSGQVGGFLKADPGTEAAALAGARWLTSAGAGELAVLELDL